MNIKLKKAEVSDAALLHGMQIKAFMPLLEMYQDYDTNPANEPIERIIQRLEQPITDFYIITFNEEEVGGVRVVQLRDGARCRISPIFILPEFQGLGIAQEVMSMLEGMYTPSNGWELDTILQERGNCYLYEKMGYRKTGENRVINDKMTLVFYEK